MSHVCINHAGLNLTCGLGVTIQNSLPSLNGQQSTAQQSATNPLVVLYIHVLLDAPIILSSPCSPTLETQHGTPKEWSQIKELKNQSKDQQQWAEARIYPIFWLLDAGKWFSGFRVLSVMFPHSSNLNEKVWKKSHYPVSLFSFSFFFSCVPCLFHFSLTPLRVRGVQLWDDEVSGKGGCAIHYRRWKGADKSPYQPCLLPTELREPSKGEIHQPLQMGHDSEITLPLYWALYIPYTGFNIVL